MCAPRPGGCRHLLRIRHRFLDGSLVVATRVRFIGHVDAAVEVPGSLLPLVLPPGIRLDRVRHQSGTEIQVRPESLTGTFVGRLNIPYISQGRVRLAWLEVQPPHPWRWGDIKTMLRSVAALGLPEPAGAGGLRLSDAANPTLTRNELAWTALGRCASAATATLANWPARMKSRRVLHSLESPRGTELIESTERRLGERIDLVGSREGRLAPVETVRRVGQVEPWTNRSVASVAAQVCAVVRSQEEQSVFGSTPPSLMVPIRALAHRAMPHQPVADPPFSSWPAAFAEAYLSGIAVLSMTARGGRRDGWVPLSDLWRLYEGWLAERTLAILTRILGAPDWMNPTTERVACGWARSGWELELHHPCSFTDESREILGSTWSSVSSRLDPDVALLARSPSGPRCVVLDAKARGRLSPGDLASEASKYLWGIRRDHPDIRGVEVVVLVAPFGGDEPYRRQQAAQWTIHGHPHAPMGRSVGQVGTDLNAEFFRELLIDKLALSLGE
jgi:ribosome biogenesis SPOUT family RNA methylase Rps3